MIVTRKPRSTYPDLSFAPLELRGPYREEVRAPYCKPEPRSVTAALTVRLAKALGAAVVLCLLIRWVLA